MNYPLTTSKLNRYDDETAPRSSLGRCLSSILQDGKEHLLIALESYLDASGNIKNVPYLTLAGMAADDLLWADFNRQWGNMLNSHPLRPNYMHMREAEKLEGEFRQDKGWTNKKVNQLVGDLLIYLSHLDKKKFRQFFCVIDMDAHRKLEQEGIPLDDPIDICNKGCPEIILGWYILDYPKLIIDSAHFFFDQTEPFEEPFKQKWIAEKERRVNVAAGDVFWSIIKTVTSADMRQHPPLQAADMLAWAVNRDLTSDADKPYRYLAGMMVEVIPTGAGIWDEKRLRARYGQQA